MSTYFHIINNTYVEDLNFEIERHTDCKGSQPNHRSGSVYATGVPALLCTIPGR